jgi:hypothetical protein
MQQFRHGPTPTLSGSHILAQVRRLMLSPGRPNWTKSDSACSSGSLLAREFACPGQLTGHMALQSEERSVPPYLNLSLKLNLATASARSGAGDVTLVGPSGSFSVPQEFI